MDTGMSVERGEGWEQVEKLLVLARSAHRTELSPARRDRIRADLLEKLTRIRERRLMARAFVAGASSVLVAVVLLKLALGVLPWVERGASSELAAKSSVQRLVAE